MVEPADFWSRHDATRADRFHGAGLGCVLAESQMKFGSRGNTPGRIEHVPKVSLVDDNHVVEALSTDRTDTRST